LFNNCICNILLSFNFNIFKKDIKTDRVNPGGLNEINELRPFESYAVQCDQENNGVLILNSIKETVIDKNTGEKKEIIITVKDDENTYPGILTAHVLI